MKRMLVITRGAWSNDNNTGNTLTNIFSCCPDFEFHNLYLRSESTGGSCFCKSVFRITEGQLINNILKGEECGELVDVENNKIDDTREARAYSMSKRVKLYTLWWMRELLWSVGKWNNEAFSQYVKSVSPDVIFMPVFGCFYPHKILAKIHKLTSARVVLYHADDNYTLKQFSLSPAYWLFRFRLRYWVRKSVGIAALNYSISSLQQEEYQKSFGKEFKILQKFHDFSVSPAVAKEVGNPIKLVFTGNISSGRWRSLALLGQALDRINLRSEKSAQLEIYTATELTDKMSKALACESIVMKGFVPSEQMVEIQSAADVLVHVESFGFKDKLEVRQSFSTKIVDYLSRAKCILAIGPEDVASMRYLKENDAAYVVTDRVELEKSLEKLLGSETLIIKYAENAWRAGEGNHHIAKRPLFYKELSQLDR